MKISKKQKSIQSRHLLAYAEGINDYNKGEMCNPYGQGQLLERCSWAAGYWDRHRGMV